MPSHSLTNTACEQQCGFFEYRVERCSGGAVQAASAFPGVRGGCTHGRLGGARDVSPGSGTTLANKVLGCHCRHSRSRWRAVRVNFRNWVRLRRLEVRTLWKTLCAGGILWMSGSELFWVF